MTHLRDLLAQADKWLQPHLFQDYCPNGLQIEGREEVSLLVSGVTASMELIERAIEVDADALIVHHGYFWKGEPAPLVGMKRRRVAKLLAQEMSLIAYHLPLDAHPELGNNARLGQLLGLKTTGGLDASPRPIGLIGEFEAPLIGFEFARRIEEKLGRAPLCVGDTTRAICRLAWCSGAAQDLIERAFECGADAYLSGEVSEQTVHFARENDMQFFAAGHHATERYGVDCLGARLAEELGCKHQFIDCANPV